MIPTTTIRLYHLKQLLSKSVWLRYSASAAKLMRELDVAQRDRLRALSQQVFALNDVEGLAVDDDFRMACLLTGAHFLNKTDPLRAVDELQSRGWAKSGAELAIAFIRARRAQAQLYREAAGAYALELPASGRRASEILTFRNCLPFPPDFARRAFPAQRVACRFDGRAYAEF